MKRDFKLDMTNLINYIIHWNYFTIIQWHNQLYYFGVIRLLNDNNYDNKVYNNKNHLMYISDYITNWTKCNLINMSEILEFD